MKLLLDRVLTFSLPVNILPDADSLYVVAGEDLRYHFQGETLGSWGKKCLDEFRAGAGVNDVLARIGAPFVDEASELIERLYSERVLIDVVPAAVAAIRGISVHGSGELYEILKSKTDHAEAAGCVQVFCQDSLDYCAAERFNSARLESSEPFIWVTTGPLQRAFVSPLFLPESGPCIACLLLRFRSLSPSPEIYDRIANYGESGAPFASSDLGEYPAALLANLVLWKLELVRASRPEAAALYRLHVLEIDSLEISSHVVAREPQCPGCGELR